MAGEVSAVGVRTASSDPSTQQGFWGRLRSGFAEFGRQATDCAAGLTSGIGPVDLPAPYQNDQTRALCKAVGATAGLLGDAFVGGTGAAEIGGGAALSTTGVGALVGVPVSAAGAAQVAVASAGAVIHTNNLGSAISEMRSASNGGGGGTTGAPGERNVYEPNPKHGSVDRAGASRAPTNGQEALDNSVRIKDTSPRRVGVDPKTKDIVVFDQHLEGKFHGHVREWGELTSEMQNALRNSGLVNARGKVL